MYSVSEAQFFTDASLVHIRPDILLKRQNSTDLFKDMILLDSKQFCEIKTYYKSNNPNQVRINEIRLLGRDNLTRFEIKKYKPYVLDESSIFDSINYARKQNLINKLGAWTDSIQAQNCREMELSYNQQSRLTQKRQIASTSLKNTFLTNCADSVKQLHLQFLSFLGSPIFVDCKVQSQDKVNIKNSLSAVFEIEEK